MFANKEINGSSLVIRIDQNMNIKDCQDLVTDVTAALTAQPALKSIFLDMGKQFDVDPAGFRILTPMGMDLRKKNQALCFLNPTKALRKLLSELGLATLFKPVQDVSEAEGGAAGGGSTVAPKSTKIDVNFINPFIAGVVHILEVQCKTKAVPQKPQNVSDPATITIEQTKFDIAGVIGITSSQFTGTIAICLPEKFFLALMTRMLDEEFKEITQDLEDGAGELLNMIYGHAKVILNQNGYSLEKALPTVIRGKDLTLKSLNATSSIVLPFETDAGPFHLKIGTEHQS